MSHVEVCSPAEAQALIDRLGLSPLVPAPSLAARLKGFVDVTCREADGSVAWEAHQENIITDFGLRCFAYGWAAATSGGGNPFLFLSPNIAPALGARYTLVDTGNCILTMAAPSTNTFSTIAGATLAYDGNTLTKTYGYTFPTGARRIGTVGLARNVGTSSGAVAGGVADGVPEVMCYTVLSPVKSQTSSQTVECLYRVTLTAIY